MPRALVVEDEPEANKLLAMLLRLRGYATESAFSGKQALELVQKSPPDIIFLDLMLPDLNGYEVCKILKSAKGTSLIPLVIITARIAAENRIESFCLGADDYIAKPYTPDQIYQSVDQAVRWLDQSRAGAIQGRIPFDLNDDGEILRRLGQLRSLIFARTAMDMEMVVLIGRAIKELWCMADEASRSVESGAQAALLYTLTPDRLTLEFHGPSDWLSRIPTLTDDANSALQRVGFNEILRDEGAGTLSLIRYLPETA